MRLIPNTHSTEACMSKELLQREPFLSYCLQLVSVEEAFSVQTAASLKKKKKASVHRTAIIHFVE